MKQSKLIPEEEEPYPPCKVRCGERVCDDCPFPESENGKKIC